MIIIWIIATNKAPILEELRMINIFSFDICAIAILAILVFALEFRKAVTDEASKRLLLLVVVTIVAAGLDIIANWHDGKSGRDAIKYFCSSVYHITRNGAFFLYASYILNLTGARYKRDRKALWVPFIVVTITAIITPFTKILYYYDENNYYVRGNAFFLIYVCNAVYAIYAFVFILKNISIIGFKKAVSLTSCAIFSLLGSLVQYSRPYMVVDILCFALSLLFIILYVDNSGDRLEPTSYLMSHQAYLTELKTDFYMSKPIDIIHINIQNFNVIEGVLSYSNCLSLIRILSGKMKEINGKNNGLLFYIKNGRYRVILNGNDIERTNQLAKSLIEMFNCEEDVNGTQISIESSVTITQCPDDFDLLDNLLDFSEIAAQVETAGKIVYSREIKQSEAYITKKDMVKLVEQGLVKNRFEVYYRPIYDVETGDYKEVETIVRLHDEDNKIWEQEAFLDIAEQNGSIFEIGQYVLHEVCRFIKSADFAKTKIERVSIKLSVVECLQKDFAKQVLDVLDGNGIYPGILNFDITESLASDNQAVFEENIKQLSDAGISFALDDYGAGYSNITSLSSLPLETIKFDEAFANSSDNERLNAIFEHSIDMVKTLGKKILIKGVRDEAHVEEFKGLKCDFLQGPFFAMPMKRMRLIEFYERLQK